MASRPIDEHRSETPTEAELLEAQRLYEQRMLDSQIRRWTDAQNDARPPGAARVRGFRAAGPGPQFNRDPFERAAPEREDSMAEEVEGGPQVGAMPYRNGATAPPSPKPKTEKLSGWKKLAAAMGESFVRSIATDPAQARRDLRDDLMRNAALIAGDVGEVEKLWRFALDIDKDLMGGKGGQGPGLGDNSALRKWIQGQNVFGEQGDG